jgi:hypothetical protein
MAFNINLGQSANSFASAVA